MQARPARVFISYSHRDEVHLKRLVAHLVAMQHEGLIDPWHDRKILPGSEWRDEVDRNLEQADLVLLLVSADFLSSKYCYEIESRHSIARHARHECLVVPIIVEPVDWANTPLGELQALPRALPVSTFSNREEAWLEVATGLRRLLQAFTQAGPRVAGYSHINEQFRALDAYRPFPSSLIERLDELTCDRGKRLRYDDALDQQIQSLVHEITTKYRAARSGDVVLGATLLEVIGSGAFGDVWRARPLGASSHDDVAIKIFQRAKLGLGKNLHAFRVGVAAMERLTEDRNRPPEVIELKASDESKTAFSMELARHRDLHEAGCDWALARSLDFFRGVCVAVHYSHRKQIRHRDIKPKNVLVTQEKKPVLTDFDIADLMFKRTLSVTANGTPHYAAPEQLLGTGSRELSSDVYSLGRLLHYMLLRRDPPWEDSIPGLADLAGQPDGLVRIIRKCTMREPLLRYQCVTELLADLDHYADPTADVGLALPDASGSRSRRASDIRAARKRRTYASFGTAALVAVGVALSIEKVSRTNLLGAVIDGDAKLPSQSVSSALGQPLPAAGIGGGPVELVAGHSSAEPSVYELEATVEVVPQAPVAKPKPRAAARKPAPLSESAFALPRADPPEPTHSPDDTTNVVALEPTSKKREDNAYTRQISAAIAAYEAEDFRRAREYFERAHWMNPSARTFRGLAHVDAVLGDYTNASKNLEAALNDPRTPLTAEMRQDVQSLLDWISQSTACLTVSMTQHAPGAYLRVDGARAALGAELRLLAGKHTVRLAADTCIEDTRSISLRKGERTQLTLDLKCGKVTH